MLDCDILVAREAPDIFRSHPRNSWLRRDSLVELRWPYAAEEWFYNGYREKIPCMPYFNTGVMLLTNDDAGTIAYSDIPKKDSPGVYEQNWINYVIRQHKVPVNWLHASNNYFMYTNKDIHEQNHQKHFAHFLGPDTKKILHIWQRSNQRSKLDVNQINI